MISSKTQEKILSIEKACKVGDLAFDYILPCFKEGVTEKEIVKKLNKFIGSRSQGLAFKTIVAFGKNSSEIHHQKPTNKKLKKGDFIMLDFGARINGYPSDMTRTLFFGKASQKQKQMYQVVLKAQHEAIGLLKSLIVNHKSIKAFDIDKIARDYILAKGFVPMSHSLGHGIGKKIHSGLKLSPKTKSYLKPGMVFSIEPAIYIKDFGGVRIEDLAVLTKNQLKILTNSPKQLIEL